MENSVLIIIAILVIMYVLYNQQKKETFESSSFDFKKDYSNMRKLYLESLNNLNDNYKKINNKLNLDFVQKNKAMETAIQKNNKSIDYMKSVISELKDIVNNKNII